MNQGITHSNYLNNNMYSFNLRLNKNLDIMLILRGVGQKWKHESNIFVSSFQIDHQHWNTTSQK